MMDAALFGRLVDSMTEMDEIARGGRTRSREFHVDAVEVVALEQQSKRRTMLPCPAFVLQTATENRRPLETVDDAEHDVDKLSR